MFCISVAYRPVCCLLGIHGNATIRSRESCCHERVKCRPSPLLMGICPQFQGCSAVAPVYHLKCSKWPLFEWGQRRLHRCGDSVKVSHAEKSSFLNHVIKTITQIISLLTWRSLTHRCTSGTPELLTKLSDQPESEGTSVEPAPWAHVSVKQFKLRVISGSWQTNAAEKSPEYRTSNRFSCFYLLPLCVWGEKQKQGIRTTETDVIATFR